MPGLGGLMRDPDEAAARMREWAQGIARKAERYEAFGQRTKEIRLSAEGAGGAVRVTIGADGAVTDLVLTERVRAIAPDELAAQILAAMRRAQAGLADRVAAVAAEEVGAEDPHTAALLVDTLRARFPDPEQVDDETDEADGRRAAPAGEDDEENAPW
jgi:DNA-binding protein YbaB